jgi:hypothetical protein
MYTLLDLACMMDHCDFLELKDPTISFLPNVPLESKEDA